MQLGARWIAGQPPHRSVPAAMHAAIASAETAHAEAESWTLSWLEGRPVCELLSAAGSVLVVSLGVGGEVMVSPRADGSSAGTPGRVEFETPGGGTATAGEEDDDDWLD
ncbi:MAG: Fe-S oxidoreductase [Actinobacteria bacterium]|nr:Fe-S oxidoreductase [Actinomycetota bacterium]